MATIEPVVIHNLPRTKEFIGREYAVNEVMQALNHRAWIVSIEGIGGVGKTTLALEVAHRLAAKKEYDALIWTSADRSWRTDYELRYESESDFNIGELMRALSQVLSLETSTSEPISMQRYKVDKELEKRSCLIIVDNLETIQRNHYEHIVEFLTNLPAPTKALVTSRRRPETGQIVVELNEMHPDEAHLLLASLLRQRGLPSMPMDKLDDVCKTAGYLPIAIQWLVGQMSVRGQSIDAVLKRIRTPSDEVLKFCFDSSLSLLKKPANRVLMSMPAFATSASRNSLEEISDVRGHRLDESLEVLQSIYLIDSTSDGRYFILPATAQCMQAHWSGNIELERDYMRRAADYFVRHVSRITALKRILELGQDHHNIRHVIDWCIHQGEWSLVAELALGLCAYLRQLGRFDELKTVARLGQDAAVEEGRHDLVAKFKQYEGSAHKYMQNYLQASKCFEDALVYYEGVNNRDEIAWATMQLAIIEEHQATSTPARKISDVRRTNLLHSAETKYRRSLEIFRQTDDKKGEARILHLIGRVYQYMGSYDAARQYYMQSIELKTALRDPECVITQYQLADLLRETANYDKAEEILREALIQVTEQGWVKHIAKVKWFYAKVLQERGDFESAARLAADAANGFQSSGRTELQRDAEQIAKACNEKLKELELSTVNLREPEPLQGELRQQLMTQFSEHQVRQIFANIAESNWEHMGEMGKSGMISVLLDFFRDRNRLSDLALAMEIVQAQASSPIQTGAVGPAPAVVIMGDYIVGDKPIGIDQRGQAVKGAQSTYSSSTVYEQLTANDQQSIVQSLLAAIDNKQLTAEEIQSVFAPLKEAIDLVAARVVNIEDDILQAQIAAANDDIHNEVGVDHKLKVALPILPPLVSYEIEFVTAGRADLGSALGELWKHLKARFKADK